jgi:hypothetical protein
MPDLTAKNGHENQAFLFTLWEGPFRSDADMLQGIHCAASIADNYS